MIQVKYYGDIKELRLIVLGYHKEKNNLKKKINVLHVITSRMQNEKYFREEVKKQVPCVIDCIELSMYDKLHITNTLHMMKW